MIFKIILIRMVFLFVAYDGNADDIDKYNKHGYLKCPSMQFTNVFTW